MPLTNNQRVSIIATAREYLLTPYHAHSKIKGRGVDCATFLLCVFRDAGLVPDIDLGNYSVQIHLHRKDTQYLETIRRYANEITEAEVQPGDIVLYKVGRAGNCDQHKRHKPSCAACIEADKDAGYHHGAIIVHWPDCIIHAVDPSVSKNGVIYSHALNEGFVQRKHKRFFTLK